jgi:RND family efflux transporter MFP subunit
MTSSFASSSPGTWLAVLLSVAATAACGGERAAQGAASPPPPTSVKLLTLEARPIEASSEFIATLRSLRSVTIQPEVDGLVTRIFVTAGSRVRAGAPLVQINADRQQAAVRSTEANRAGVEADVSYWRQQVERLESLLEAGAISRQEFDQAQNTLRTAEARLGALDAQLSEGRVQLQYHRVDAPQAGIVGDIAVRVGDRVTTSTVITTIDESAGFEAYIQVPLDRAPDLRPGLPVHLLDTDGQIVATNPISFIAPRVDDGTQTVLVKSALAEVPAALRVRQFVRARLVWRSEPGLTIPVTAVTRVSGQHFCYVAEPSSDGLVARQRPVQLGEIVGNDYVVRSGLSPGERLVVEGIQKIGNGTRVRGE